MKGVLSRLMGVAAVVRDLPISEVVVAVAAVGVAAVGLAPFEAAAAVVTTGGVDPVVGATNFLNYTLLAAGAGIPCICAFKGAHAVAEGNRLMPHVVHAVAGSGLAFGGAYAMHAWGIT